jgi:hypothetical protein
MGWIRFMAPKGALGDWYNISVDIYSFATLFWLQGKGLGELSQEEHNKRIIQKNECSNLKQEYFRTVRNAIQENK